MFAPSMALDGAAPAGAALTPSVRHDVLKRLGGARGARLQVEPANHFGRSMVSAVHSREVPLGPVDKRLAGVVALGYEPVVVGNSGGRAAVMGTLPNAADTEGEVHAFVASLMAQGQFEPGAAKTRSRSRAAPAGADDADNAPTHAVQTVAGKKVLRRVRFRCLCC